MTKKPLKVCVGASSGGHMVELMALLEHTNLWPVEPAVYVASRDVWRTALEKRGRFYAVGECDRYKPLQAVATLCRAFWVALRERPDVLVTTGSLPIALVCVFVKLFGGKVVWIDSVAQLDGLSMSGKLMRRVADLCLAQWPEVAAKNPGVEYCGELR